MCDVGHSMRWIAIEPLKIVLIWTHNHQVRTNMELLAPFPRFRPSATVHVRNADAIDVRRAAGQAVLHPLQEYWVEAPWLVVRISGNTGKAGDIRAGAAYIFSFDDRDTLPLPGKSPGRDSSSRAATKNDQIVFFGLRFPRWLVCGSVLHRAHILSFLECRNIRSPASALRLPLWSYTRLTTRPRACEMV